MRFVFSSLGATLSCITLWHVDVIVDAVFFVGVLLLYLLARRMLTCGLADSGSGTQSGWMRLKSWTWSRSKLKQHTPTDGPTATTMLLTLHPNSVTIVSTVAVETPIRVPFQPEEQIQVTEYAFKYCNQVQSLLLEWVANRNLRERLQWPWLSGRQTGSACSRLPEQPEPRRSDRSPWRHSCLAQLFPEPKHLGRGSPVGNQNWSRWLEISRQFSKVNKLNINDGVWNHPILLIHRVRLFFS